MSPAAGDRLARMLGGQYPDLLIEWLTAAAARRAARAGGPEVREAIRVLRFRYNMLKELDDGSG